MWLVPSEGWSLHTASQHLGGWLTVGGDLLCEWPSRCGGSGGDGAAQECLLTGVTLISGGVWGVTGPWGDGGGDFLYFEEVYDEV